jgi:hypothetical protein
MKISSYKVMALFSSLARLFNERSRESSEAFTNYFLKSLELKNSSETRSLSSNTSVKKCIIMKLKAEIIPRRPPTVDKAWI